MPHTLSAAKYLVSTYSNPDIIGKEIEEKGIKYTVEHLVVVPNRDAHGGDPIKLTIRDFLDNGLDNEKALKKIADTFGITFSEYDVYVILAKDPLQLNLKWETFITKFF